MKRTPPQIRQPHRSRHRRYRCKGPTAGQKSALLMVLVVMTVVVVDTREFERPAARSSVDHVVVAEDDHRHKHCGNSSGYGGSHLCRHGGGRQRKSLNSAADSGVGGEAGAVGPFHRLVETFNYWLCRSVESRYLLLVPLLSFSSLLSQPVSLRTYCPPPFTPRPSPPLSVAVIRFQLIARCWC